MGSLYFGTGYQPCFCARKAKATQALSTKQRLSEHSLLWEPWRLEAFAVVTGVVCHGASASLQKEVSSHFKAMVIGVCG